MVFYPILLWEAIKLYLREIFIKKINFFYGLSQLFTLYWIPQGFFYSYKQKEFWGSHFIAGEKLMGFDDYYKPEQTMRLLDILDIGIQPVFLKTYSIAKNVGMMLSLAVTVKWIIRKLAVFNLKKCF